MVEKFVLFYKNHKIGVLSATYADDLSNVELEDIQFSFEPCLDEIYHCPDAKMFLDYNSQGWYFFFDGRIFPECRPDKYKLLDSLGLSEYNRWSILKANEFIGMCSYIWGKPYPFDDRDYFWKSDAVLMCTKKEAEPYRHLMTDEVYDFLRTEEFEEMRNEYGTDEWKEFAESFKFDV